MKKIVQTLLLAMCCLPTAAFAAAESEGDGSFLLTLFIGFFAVIVVFQLVPAVILFVGMVKGLVSRDAKVEKNLKA